MTKDSAKFLRVTDSSCTAESPERVHDVFIRGVLIRTVFKFGEELVLPFEHGIKFMLDGFKVEETDGTAVNLPAVASEIAKATLAVDQVVANLSELTVASLKIRAGQKPGGEVFLDAEDDARGDLIDFIIGKPPAGVADKVEIIDGQDDLVDHEGDDDGITTIKHQISAPTPVIPPFIGYAGEQTTVGNDTIVSFGEKDTKTE